MNDGNRPFGIVFSLTVFVGCLVSSCAVLADDVADIPNSDRSKHHSQKKNDFIGCKVYSVEGGVLSTKLNAVTPTEIVARAGSTKKAIPLSSVLRIDFPGNNGSRENGSRGTGSRGIGSPREAETLLLSNGDRLIVRLQKISQEELQAEWSGLPGWSTVKMNLTFVKAVFYSLPENVRKKRTIQRRLLSDVKENDLVLLRNGDRQRGEFQNLDRSQLTLHTGKVDCSKILGIRFDPRFTEIPKTSASSIVVFLKNGSRITGNLKVPQSNNSLSMQAEFGQALTIPFVSLASIEFWDSRKIPLSNFKPQEYRFQPYLSGKWSFGKNVNVLGGPLRIRSRESSTGIGMHSRSEMSFALNRQYKSFQTWIGIDDDANGKGNALFEIRLDGKSVFKSKPVTGRMDAVKIEPIDVGNAQRITLIVDYGDDADVGDYANWFGAILVKKKSQPIPAK